MPGAVCHLPGAPPQPGAHLAPQLQPVEIQVQAPKPVKAPPPSVTQMPQAPPPSVIQMPQAPPPSAAAAVGAAAAVTHMPRAHVYPQKPSQAQNVPIQIAKQMPPAQSFSSPSAQTTNHIIWEQLQANERTALETLQKAQADKARFLAASSGRWNAGPPPQ